MAFNRQKLKLLTAYLLCVIAMLDAYMLSILCFHQDYGPEINDVLIYRQNVGTEKYSMALPGVSPLEAKLGVICRGSQLSGFPDSVCPGLIGFLFTFY